MNAAKINAPPYFTAMRRKGGVAYYFKPPPGRRPAGWPDLAEPWPAGVERTATPRLSDGLHEALGQAQSLHRAMRALATQEPLQADLQRGSIPWLVREFLTAPLYADRHEGWSDAHRRNTLRNWEWWQGISARLVAAKLRIGVEAVQPHQHQAVSSAPTWDAKAISMALAMPAIKNKLTMRRALRASLSLLMGVAVVEGLLDRNPCADVKISMPRTTFHAFTDDEVAALIEAAPSLGEHGEAMARLIAVMSEIGQREGDALRLQHGRDYAHGLFRFRQSKTGAMVEIPAPAYLRAIIDRPDTLGRIVDWPHSVDYLRHEFRALCRAIGLPDEAKLMHLRHYAVMRMRRLGFEALAISSITGHSPQSVNQMLARHYSTGTSEQAAAVVARLDEARKA